MVVALLAAEACFKGCLQWIQSGCLQLRRPLGGVEVAQATLDRLRADSAVSRRPSTLLVAGEGEA